MKLLKKLLNIVLAGLMITSLSITTFAEGEDESGSETTKTYTITAPDNGHTYEIYQVFTGNLDETTGKLMNLRFGVSCNSGEVSDVGQVVEDSYLEEIEEAEQEGSQALLKVLTQRVKFYYPVATITNGATARVPSGYYVIKDKDNSVSGDDSYTLYEAVVSKNFTITPKSGEPELYKIVNDYNDSKLSQIDDALIKYSVWNPVGDMDTDDDVEFELTAKIDSSYYQYYDRYPLVYHDSSDNFTFKQIDLVGVSYKTKEDNLNYQNIQLDETKYSLRTDNLTDDCLFELTINDLKSIEELNDAIGDINIYIEYTANFKEGSIVKGGDGNKNTAKLDYFNNPNQVDYNDDYRSKGTTVDATAKVFTYDFVINKYKDSVAEGNELDGATFELDKLVITKDTNGTVINESWEKNKTISDTTNGVYTFEGLDSGVYRLVETTAPSGYNKVDSLYFEIVPEYEYDSTVDELSLKGLTIKEYETFSKYKEETGEFEDYYASLSNNQLVYLSENINTYDVSEDCSTISINLVDKSGVLLPETGGIGTTIFYVAGGTLMMIAAVLFVIKRKAHN